MFCLVCVDVQMAVLEIQANGDAVVSKDAVSNAGQSLEDPLMRVSAAHAFLSQILSSQEARSDFCLSESRRDSLVSFERF